MATYTTTKVLGTYSLISGGFNGSGESYFQSIVGNGVNATQTTSNYYSSGSGTTAIFTYNMSFSDLPSDMTNISCSLSVNGHPESTSNSNEYMCVQLKSGSTNLTEQYNFKSSGTTSNTTYTLDWNTTPSRSQLQNLKLECTLGYYGGAINGATLTLTYTSSSGSSSSSSHITYFGYGNQAKKVSKIYFGYGNQAKKVKKGYIGIGGAAKLFYTAEEPLTYTYTGNYTEKTIGNYTVLQITGTGTLTFSRDCTIDIWMCGGGSGGGRATGGQGGGGGGGGHINTGSRSMSGATGYTVTIGSGGRSSFTGGTTSIQQGSTSIISASGGNISDGGSGGGGRGKSSSAGAGSGGDGDGSNGGPFRPFNSSSYYSNYTCAGGGGGASYRYSFSLQGRGSGGDGGTQGDDGENGSTSGSAGGYGGGDAGDGGDSVSSGTASNGSSAGGYGNGGGGGGGYYYEESTNNATQHNGTGGSGTQGICFIRFLTVSS